MPMPQPKKSQSRRARSGQVQSRPSQPRRQPRSRPSSRASGSAKDWSVFYYLCGDNVTDGGALVSATKRDIREIAVIGGSKSMHVAAQWDLPEGCSRCVMADGGGKYLDEMSLGVVNSGSAEALLSFLRWAIERCPSRHIALVISGTGILDRRSVVGLQDREPDRVFAICDDSGARDAMDLSQLGAALDEAIRTRADGAPQIDVLAFDFGHSQFLEVACELQGRVGVLVGAQTDVPDEGWDNRAVLRAWHDWLDRKGASREAADIDPVAGFARVTVDACGRSYSAQSPARTPIVVSALDLRRLESLIGPFDTMSVAFLQHLSDTLVWNARSDAMARPELKGFLFDAWYDMRAVMAAVSAELGTAARERSVGRLADLLKELDRGRTAQALEAIAAVIAERLIARRQADPDAQSTDPVLRQFAEWHAIVLQAQQHVWMLIQEADRQARRPNRRPAAKSVSAAPKQETRLALPDFSLVTLEPTEVSAGVRVDPITLWEELLQEAGRRVPAEIRVAFDAALQETRHARRLETLTGTVAQLLTPRGDASSGDPSAPAATAKEDDRLPILRLYRANSQLNGLSLYRPQDLKELTRRSYLALRFSRRLHWTPLLTAIHLIKDQPESLWRLVTSMLVTARQAGRQDLVARLAGPQSVIRVGGQFSALGPAPAAVLTLEPIGGEGGTAVEAPAVEGDTPSVAAVSAVYRVRLASARQDTIVFEKVSRVNPNTIDQALRRLDELLRTHLVTGEQLRYLHDLGALVGEDIIRELIERIEEERVHAGGDLHLQLQIPASLMRYPWEVIRDRHGWWSERFSMGRQVILPVGTARWHRTHANDRLRVLIIGDPDLPPTSSVPPLPGAALEARQVARIFQRLADETGDLIEFNPDRDVHIGEVVNSDRVRSWLRSGDYDIVHFAGHARFDPADPEQSAWLLSDGELRASEIRNTLMVCDAPPWLVYANACESGRESGATQRYQEHVHGLATAFLVPGVTAYVAPLWPIDDRAAMLAATDFYQALVLDRATLGEALRLAKRAALSRLPELDPDAAHASIPVTATVGLSWASLVLYGDPTATLMQRLGTLLEDAPQTDASPTTGTVTPETEAWRDLSLRRDAGVIDGLPVDAARLLPFPAARAIAPSAAPDDTPKGALRFDVVEEAGLRIWRVTQGTRASAALPGSPFATLLQSERQRVRARRGTCDPPRLLRQWLVRDADARRIDDLVRSYDEAIVPDETLRVITVADHDIRCRAMDADLRSEVGRRGEARSILLLLPDGLSCTDDMVRALGAPFFDDPNHRYGVVLGYDHWTLSKSPQENADALWTALPIELRQGRQRFDIIAYGRGGLVARALALGPRRVGAIRRVASIGTPFAGSLVSDPANWPVAADLLLNTLHLDDMGLYGRWATLLARLTTVRAGASMDRIPGLTLPPAPTEALAAAARGIDELIVAASFTPGPGDTVLRRLLRSSRVRAVAGFDPPHDLLVPLASAWDGRTGGAIRLLSIVGRGRQATRRRVPAGAETISADGVHHTNLLAFAPVKRAVRHHCWDDQRS